MSGIVSCLDWPFDADGALAYCTVFRGGEFWSCDTVTLDHRHGASPDGLWVHVEGVHLPDDRTVAFGLQRGSWTPDGRTIAKPCGHGKDVSEAASGESP